MQFKQFYIPNLSPCPNCNVGVGVAKQSRFGFFYKCNCCKRLYNTKYTKKVNKWIKLNKAKKKKRKATMIKDIQDNEDRANAIRYKYKGL